MTHRCGMKHQYSCRVREWRIGTDCRCKCTCTCHHNATAGAAIGACGTKLTLNRYQSPKRKATSAAKPLDDLASSICEDLDGMGTEPELAVMRSFAVMRNGAASTWHRCGVEAGSFLMPHRFRRTASCREAFTRNGMDEMNAINKLHVAQCQVYTAHTVFDLS